MRIGAKRTKRSKREFDSVKTDNRAALAFDNVVWNPLPLERRRIVYATH
jgi:hypothetical protein